ncbi:flagellar basal body P-ring formation chaperone FlgA [Desulfonatronospira sp.]|uniref:flagellar basal body P-ring formation chaperone FlgA n=1 Tax=Desulfonatronospira sp. TaxID=1962951 RepID=UPI0025BD8C3D|nr:flagellar basal body P-ring formation chaperone FlgA [Desulfonatronospira sp.]
MITGSDSGMAGSSEGLFWIDEHVAISGDVITFGDIATPRNARAEQYWSDIKDTQLWRAPNAGQRIVLDRARVQQRLEVALGDLAQASIIPREIIFQRGRRVLDDDHLEDIVRDYIGPRVNSLGERIVFRDFRLPSPIFLESPYEEVEIETVRDPGPGRNSLRFVVRDGHGQVVRRHTGNVFVDVWVTVACADRPLNRGDIIEPGDVRFEEKNLAYVRREVWNGQSGPWRIRSSIGQGQPIYKRSLEPVPMVSRGSRVDMVYEGNHLTLVVPGKVLEDGQRGDRIMVRNMQSNKEVRATVESSGRVSTR